MEQQYSIIELKKVIEIRLFILDAFQGAVKGCCFRA